MTTRKQQISLRRKRRIEKSTERNKRARMATAQTADAPQKRQPQPPIDRYFAYRQITREQHAAGTMLYEQWLGMGGHGSLTGAYGQTIPGTSAESPYQVRCYIEYRAAIQAVGIFLSPVLFAVCVQDEPAGEWARRYNRSEKDGIAILRLALDALAVHYGFLKQSRVLVDGTARAVLFDTAMLEKVCNQEPRGFLNLVTVPVRPD